MALQAGVQTSKVIILVGAGLTGSIVLRSGRLSELISQLQELLKGVDGAEISLSPQKYDTALIAAQIRQLAQEIKELSLSNPITIFNGNSDSNGSFASYLVPAAALGAMGYCYMWWKGWSLSDVMFVTKKNMANAVANVSSQLEHVSKTLASTKKQLAKRLENLDWKLEEQKETSRLIANDVDEMNSNLSHIGYDVDMIQQMLFGLEGKIELLESKQDITNKGLWYLCQCAGGFKDGLDAKLLTDFGAKLANPSALTCEETSLKGLQFLADNNEPGIIKKSTISTKQNEMDNFPAVKDQALKTRIHRSYPVGISWARDIAGFDM
ncbi:DUF1664 domain-containing protein [Cephalotus follicularis]|uniref:DUF1664 domain-containing protein n=1 Tax=Cephalotus follicularis TaxID=3775 RepID=A0A1Q3B325_CEPFO|nr:DUF1664 domain-containing protein [Cephalotus follicularis]